MYIKSKYESTCQYCKEKIKIGSLISWKYGGKAIHRKCKLDAAFNNKIIMKEDFHKSSVKDKNLDIGLHVRIQKNKRSRKYIDISANTLKQIKEKFKLNYEKAIKSSKTIRFDKDNNKIKQIKI